MSFFAFLKISKHTVAKKGKFRKTNGGFGISENVGSEGTMDKFEEEEVWSFVV